MKRIVAFGDSNTWGYIPLTAERYTEDVRWTSIMQKQLGPEFKVEEEGLNGRTTAFDDPVNEFRNGSKYIEACMLTNKPVDLLIVMLGTNDLKKIFKSTAFFIMKGMDFLLTKAVKPEYGRNGTPPKVLLISPIMIGENISELVTGESIDETGVKECKCLSKYYKQLSDEAGYYFMDASEYAKPSEADAVHMEMEEHKKLGIAIAEKVRRIFD